MKHIYTFLMLFLFSNVLFAQDDSIAKSPLTFSGYLDVYYAFDLDNPDDHLRPGFMYSFNRHNEFNINLAMVKLNFSKEKLRANIGLMAGTYASANLASEPLALRYVYEANAGIKLSKSKNLWLDAGIMPSHIGLESAIGRDNWTLSRSILADNSPYYESGAKLGYTSANGKWFLSGMVLNGWQRIARPTGNNSPAFGHQITWKPSTKITLNSSSFVGNDKPDSVAQMRVFHNFYSVFQLSDRIGAALGFDIGAEKPANGGNAYNIWYSPLAIVRAQLTDRLTLAARGEYYVDPNGVILPTGTTNGFRTLGYSLNADVAILDNVLWRIEGRGFSSMDPIFLRNNQPTRANFGMTTSLCVAF